MNCLSPTAGALRPSLPIACVLALLVAPLGCRRTAEEPTDAPTPPRAETAESPSPEASPSGPMALELPVALELDAQQLLAMRLPEEEAREGWIRLFDGQTLFGWEMAGEANWRIEDDTLVVDAGEMSLLCTSLDWLDYELTLEFRADAQTNSGIFLRTPLVPEDPAVDCYELNIAPPENAFPTGSLVGRERIEPEQIGPIDPDAWHRYDLRVEGAEVRVLLNGDEILHWTDPNPLGPGRIGLQHNEGQVAFRDIRLRPLGMRSLLEGEDLEQWVRYPEMPGSFEQLDDGSLHVQGGRTQLESRESFGDFVLMAELQTLSPEANSGIFFRCIPGEEMMGYECQISNVTIDDDPLRPDDSGTGGIFRRQDARIVAAGENEWFSLVLAARGPVMAAWVNGIQVTDWMDTREPDENPRRGLRTEPGTLMIQGHDPTTEVQFRQLQIVGLDEA